MAKTNNSSMTTYVHLLLLLISSCPILANAFDTILQGQLIRVSDTIVSSGNVFELGFFSAGGSNSTMSYYVGLWFKKISEQTVVWVANRDYPLTDSSAVLTIGVDGNLVIVEGRISYMINNISSTGGGNTSATLLDSGNLVLTDGRSGDLLWQSFDYPTHTFLPGMKLGYDRRNGKTWSLLSWKSQDDPRPGVFSLELDPQGTSQFFIMKGSQKYWASGTWNGQIFAMMPEMGMYNDAYKLTYISNQNESYFTSFNDPSTVDRCVFDISGQLQYLSWLESTHEWILFWSQQRQECEVYAYCGAFSSCNQNAVPFCSCLRGFQPLSDRNWNAVDKSGGCSRRVPLQCGKDSQVSGQKDRFLRISKVRLPVNPIVLQVSPGVCESACSSNCSCSAYTYGDDGCSIWIEDLLNMQQLKSNDPNGRDLYLKLASSEFQDSGSKRWKWIIPAIAVSMTLLTTAFFFYMWRRKLQKKGEDLLLFDPATSIGAATYKRAEDSKSRRTGRNKEVDLPLFSIASVSAATDNFSDANKLGEGGFGPVYKGKILKGHEVAVKRLSRKSGQGLEELQNEAMLIAKLQHKNLVRLLGCCIERDEKILIYEYMHNKSLDFFLFDPIKHGMLNWELRVNIIEGIAQGLLYLHQYSRLRIIHRDLKASNILLDKDMNPKISDFGMARIFGENGSQATKRIVGTYGYMSPEYVLRGLFSIKSDVFSFGVLLLEILSGKKNTGFYNSDSLTLLGYAWDLWRGGRGQELKDPIIEDVSCTNMLLRYINIALLCVQESAADRPTMSNVVSMLSNELVLLPSPKQPAFSTCGSVVDQTTSMNPEIYSLNDETFSILEAR
ncbi:receptor-like serine/threonine-protein kinase SD1-8 [Actinidia eriantha]|uniref:receptor-like serine/threonine-protein kinase SD1-8 n=1 Tax=Actinidia eriantha TaxID=165200 RepID=UPI00258A6ED2|nr:receptor-like serine/threonine-protein kinase SD1-8 [Actinidia eriantha]